jgi:hypothetical protein
LTKPRWLPPHLRTGSEEQRETRKLFEACGGLVYQTSDPNMRRADPGIPDKLIFLPNRAVLLAWDDKAGEEYYRPTDPRRLTEEQRAFGALMGRGYRTDFAWGDAEAAKAYLMGHS